MGSHDKITWPQHYSFVESLTGLTDGLAIGRAGLRGGNIAIGFSG